MGLREIENEPEFGPYSAIVANDGLSSIGVVRIEPPFIPGSLLDWDYEGDYIGTKVRFSHWASDSRATQLEYEFESNEPDEVTGTEIAASATKELLQHLGMLADKELFKNEWAPFTAE